MSKIAAGHTKQTGFEDIHISREPFFKIAELSSGLVPSQNEIGKRAKITSIASREVRMG